MQLFLLWLIPGRKRTSRGKGKFRITCHLHDSIKNSHLTSKTSALTVSSYNFLPLVWSPSLCEAATKPKCWVHQGSAMTHPADVGEIEKLMLEDWRVHAERRGVESVWLRPTEISSFFTLWKIIFQLKLLILWLCLSPRVGLQENIRKLFFCGSCSWCKLRFR